MAVSFRIRLPGRPTTAEVFDVVIVGAGPAGLSAALYAARLSLKTLVVAESVGGTLNAAGVIDDYIGLPDISGPELAKKFEFHVAKYGVPVVIGRVVRITKSADMFETVLQDLTTYRSRAVILAVGSLRKKLGVAGEDRLVGRGVTYCAACDAPMFRGKDVAVVGGGNSALQGALLMAFYASKVYLIHRRDSFRAFPIYVDLVKKDPKIELVLNSVVVEIGGEDRVEWIRAKNVLTNEERRIEVSGILIEIGSESPREFLQSIGVELDEDGFVLVRPGQKTNIDGLFAAGDCAGGPYKKKFDQIVTAAAEGAIAAYSAYEYIIEKFGGTIAALKK